MLQDRLAGRALQGGEVKAGFPVSFEDELHATLAKIADAIEEQDRIFFRVDGVRLRSSFPG